jgi:hypothetical protein
MHWTSGFRSGMKRLRRMKSSTSEAEAWDRGWVNSRSEDRCPNSAITPSPKHDWGTQSALESLCRVVVPICMYELGLLYSFKVNPSYLSLSDIIPSFGHSSKCCWRFTMGVVTWWLKTKGYWKWLQGRCRTSYHFRSQVVALSTVLRVTEAENVNKFVPLLNEPLSIWLWIHEPWHVRTSESSPRDRKCLHRALRNLTTKTSSGHQSGMYWNIFDFCKYLKLRSTSSLRNKVIQPGYHLSKVHDDKTDHKKVAL